VAASTARDPVIAAMLKELALDFEAEAEQAEGRQSAWRETRPTRERVGA
jgi:hypothetical protein